MQPSRPEHNSVDSPSSDDLPYGPLPVRARRRWAGPSESQSLDQLVDLSWLEPHPPAPPEDPVDEEPEGGPYSPSHEDLESPSHEDLESPSHEDQPESATGMSLASPRPEADDDVHFGVAASALGVSRKTVERMVKRGQLERGPSNAPATVSKRALVAVLEQRRRDVSHLTRATEIEQTKSGNNWLTEDASRDPVSALRELLVPVLAPLLDEFVAVRTRAAVLENQLEGVRDRADQERTRDELLLALATKGWWGRRKTRRAVLRHYVLGEDPSDQDSEIR
jgi:hypothetical protein